MGSSARVVSGTSRVPSSSIIAVRLYVVSYEAVGKTSSNFMPRSRKLYWQSSALIGVMFVDRARSNKVSSSSLGYVARGASPDGHEELAAYDAHAGMI